MAPSFFRQDDFSARELKVLLVEDDAADAELCLNQLRRSGFAVKATVVQTQQEFNSVIAEPWDVILADQVLPGWNGSDVLATVQKMDLGTPVILVTGRLEEQQAAEYIRRGAADYVLKEGLVRIPFAVEAALAWHGLQQEWRRAQEALCASEERYRMLFERNLAGVYRVTLEGRILDLNDAGARIFGYATSREAKEHPLWEISTNPEDLKNLIRMTLEQRTITNLEIRLLRRDGSPVWVLFNATLLEGTPTREPLIEGTLIDITERKEADEALRQSEKRFRALIENSSDAISLIDGEGKVLFSSHATSPILGYELKDRIGRDIFELLHPDDRGVALAAFSRLLASPRNKTSVQVRYRHKQGHWRWLEALGNNLLEEPGVRAIVVNYRDITERKQLEEQLFQSQKMEAVGRLAGGVAHDFNNLLTAILGYSEIVIDKLPSASQLRRNVVEIKRAAERAASLTRQLLAFSRMQVMSPQVLDLNSVIAELTRMLRRLIGEDIDLITVPAKWLGRVKADPTQIEQVIMNLALNARDAMPHGGKLIIETSNATLDATVGGGQMKVEPGPYVLLSVKDTGCGMDKETRARVFEPFFTTKEKGKGTGLGLATVYGIVKQSGGYIWVESEKDQGATFKIYLPVVEEQVSGIPEAEASSGNMEGDETILLVEDESSVRLLVQTVLEAKGYHVLDARSGDDAIKLCENYKGRLDMVLTDMVLPEISGRDLARRLTSIRPSTKVLFMSGYSGATVGGESMLEINAAFIQKPFTTDTLARKVREVLDSACSAVA